MESSKNARIARFMNHDTTKTIYCDSVHFSLVRGWSFSVHLNVFWFSCSSIATRLGVKIRSQQRWVSDRREKTCFVISQSTFPHLMRLSVHLCVNLWDMCASLKRVFVDHWFSQRMSIDCVRTRASNSLNMLLYKWIAFDEFQNAFTFGAFTLVRMIFIEIFTHFSCSIFY